MTFLRARRASGGSEYLPREVGDDRQYLVCANVDAEHVPEVAAKAEQAGARSRASRRGARVGKAFRQVSRLQQKLHGAVHCGLGETRQTGQLGA